MDERRRRDDDRIDDLVEKVEEIRDMLISEPEASPLGRALLRASKSNRTLIDKNHQEHDALIERHHQEFRAFLKEEFRPLNDWWNQSRGAWKFVLGVATVLGAIGAFFGILAYFGISPH